MNHVASSVGDTHGRRGVSILSSCSQDGWSWCCPLGPSGLSPTQTGAPRAHAQVAFEDLQGRDSTTSLGYLCQCSTQHGSAALYSGGSYCVLQFVPAASCPGTGYYLKEPGSVFAPSLQVFVDTEILWAFYSTDYSPSSSLLSLEERRNASAPQLYLLPFVGLFPVCPCLLYQVTWQQM